MPQQKIHIQGMHCRSCEVLLEEDLGKISGVTKVRANFQRGEAVVEYVGESPHETEIRSVIEQAGYRLGGTATSEPWFSREAAVYGKLIFGLAGFGFLFLLFKLTGWSSLFSVGKVNTSELPLIFLVGVTAGISTCAALVGGLVLGVSARYQAVHPELSTWRKFVPHLWFHAGRIGGFFLLGSLLGFIGNWLSQSIVFTALLTLFAGGVMLLLGVQLSQVSPRASQWSITLPKFFSRWLGSTRSPEHYTHRGAFLGGALTFFLPCGFTQAVQLAVVSLADPWWGGIVMAVFALGTVPGLLAIGGLVTWLGARARTVFFPLIAVMLIAFGWWNIRNGLQLFGINTALPETETSAENTLAPLENGIQVVRLIQDARGYHPSTLPTLRIGVPARLIVDSQESYTCASSFVIPELGIQRQLKPGENIIEFTPTESGRLPFSCSMGMFRGNFQVQ
jgi:sulfite exporter TauE/SafE/copper chaperone CopZ